MKDMKPITELHGLPGCKNPKPAVFFKSWAKAIRALENKMAATTAADNGCINVWIDDSGIIKGERQLYCVTQDWFSGSTIHELIEWIKEQQKLI